MSDRHEMSAEARPCASRRAILIAAGGIGMTGVLAACGNDAPATTGPVAGPQSQGAPTPGSTAGAAPAGPLATTTDIPVGGGKVVNGILVVQPSAGTFKAYSAACPHQGVQLIAPKDGVSRCPAHNSTFAIADGAVLDGPATRGLVEVTVSVEGTNIVQA
ncbi:MAG TPA: Rieske (2Fe-2S) protein [Catenuloplanes sp.]